MVLISVIIGLIDALKSYGLQKKRLPIDSLVFGVLGGVYFLFPDDWHAGLLEV